jgi:hypothetical protein
VNHDQAVAALTATSHGWRKPTYSQAANDCVQVNTTLPGWVGVRDSKNPHGPVVAFRMAAWATLLTSVGQ